jgi:hypothetical protein
MDGFLSSIEGMTRPGWGQNHRVVDVEEKVAGDAFGQRPGAIRARFRVWNGPLTERAAGRATVLRMVGDRK